MYKDHRPYFVKKAHLQFERFYVRRFLRPQLEFLGEGGTFMKPWHIEVFGGPVRLGRFVNVVATSDQKIRLSVWSESPDRGGIFVGDYCFIGPGVRISSADRIEMGNNCMLASKVYITDSDWHGVYDRISFGTPSPVKLEENVWLGDRVIVCKGVTIGKNSIVGAGAVVTNCIPANVMAAGNPARVIRSLDSTRPMIKRSDWFADPRRLKKDIDDIDRQMLRQNTLGKWLRHLLAPRRGE